MATFETPRPITVTLAITAGDIRIHASERADTLVEVGPTDASNDLDVKAAAQVRVDYERGRLLVKERTGLRRRAGLRGGGSVDVRIELPEGSHVRGGSAWAALHTEGRLGEVRFETVQSDIRLDRTGPLRVTAVRGEIFAGRVVGRAEITNNSGEVHIDTIEGSAVIANDNGDTTIGEITGALRLTGVNGAVDVTRARGDVEARTAHGGVRIGEVGRGRIRLTTFSGGIEVGVRTGTAVRFDVSTVSGHVRNLLEIVDGPERSDEIVEIHARTFEGEVVIRRS